ncbi:MAG TPA: type II toxin-antitoxin system RelE/ParE family toxin [Candidatus Paceibacterota bacterium]
MEVIMLPPVEKFLNSLEKDDRADVGRLLYALSLYGHSLGMPFAKPIGDGLWELRKTGRPQIRILYGFCKHSAILLVGVKKQRPSLENRDLTLAQKRFAAYCGI